eukprot:3040681-Alexandrium_andersonii.AAC.1
MQRRTFRRSSRSRTDCKGRRRLSAGRNTGSEPRERSGSPICTLQTAKECSIKAYHISQARERCSVARRSLADPGSAWELQ